MVKPYTARRHKPTTQLWVFLDELPGGDEQPPGNTSRIDSILMYCTFRGSSDRGKRKS